MEYDELSKVMKSFSLNSFNLSRSIALVLIALITAIIFLHYNMAAAKTEKTVLNYSINSLKQLFHTSILLNKYTNLDINKWQGNLAMVVNRTHLDIKYVTNNYDVRPGSWAYNTESNQLVYRVSEVKYFKGVNGQPFIVMSVIKNKEHYVLQISKYRWCQKMTWWGCQAW